MGKSLDVQGRRRDIKSLVKGAFVLEPCSIDYPSEQAKNPPYARRFYRRFRPDSPWRRSLPRLPQVGPFPHVARGERAEQAAKPGAVGFRAACHFAEHLNGSDGRQRAYLRFDALAVRGNPCIAVNHAAIMTVTYAKESAFRINSLGFLHKS